MKRSWVALFTAFLLSVTSVANADTGGQEVSVEVTVYDDGSIVETGSEADRMVGQTSTALSNGRLSLRADNCNYVRVSYSKTGGTPINLKLGWFSGNAGGLSATRRNVANRDTATATWSQTRVPGNVVGYMEVEGQGRFQTPAVSCD